VLPHKARRKCSWNNSQRGAHAKRICETRHQVSTRSFRVLPGEINGNPQHRYRYGFASRSRRSGSADREGSESKCLGLCPDTGKAAVLWGSSAQHRRCRVARFMCDEFVPITPPAGYRPAAALAATRRRAARCHYARRHGRSTCTKEGSAAHVIAAHKKTACDPRSHAVDYLNRKDGITSSRHRAVFAYQQRSCTAKSRRASSRHVHRIAFRRSHPCNPSPASRPESSPGQSSWNAS